MTTASAAVRQEVFEDLELKVIEQEGEEWFSAEDIGKALGYEQPRLYVMKLFNRNRDEFDGLYRVVNLGTWLKSGLKLPYRFNTFNPQGAYLLAILARTPKSKALRRWLAKFMAHDLESLRAHVKNLENQSKKLSAKLGATTRELNKAQEKLATVPPMKALPGPETTQLPYECQNNDLVWVYTEDLHRLVNLACQVNQEYEAPWLQRVLTANGRLDMTLEMVLHGWRALRNLLENFPQLPPAGLRRIIDEERRSPKS